MKKMALLALKQINQNTYSAELTQCAHITHVLKVGIAFRDKSVMAAYETENSAMHLCTEVAFFGKMYTHDN